MKSSFQLAMLSAGLAVGISACGATPPPKELIDARASFEKAAAGKAAELAPADLDDARLALQKAEEAFGEEPEAQPTRDLAYIADRKAMLAATLADILLAERLRTGADKAYREQSAAELAKAREQLSSGKQELAAEKAARIEAERRAKAAMDSLAQVAAVKEESRGVVITLSGAVLFAPSKSALLPIAKDKLDQVAKAIKDQGGSPTLLVEGHTDNTGPRWQNMELSQKRADAVRDYLLSQGIPAERVKAVGLGPDRPVTDNTSADARANNRRVEIVVK